MAYISIDSDLKRKRWMSEGLLQAKSQSFWASYTGMSADSVVFQANNLNAADGHTVVFDYDGSLAGKAIKGKETAFGKGEQKRKFSDKVTVERYRLVVDNGDAFDAVDVGDLSLSEHADSRRKLGDLFTRFKDQAIFDAMQGVKGQAPSHVIDLGNTFDYNSLLDIEVALKTSTDFSVGGRRRPLQPFKLEGGMPCWALIADAKMCAKLKKSNQYQTIVINADLRGNENRAIKGLIGKIGSMLVIEADQFFGTSAGVGIPGVAGTSGASANLGLDDSSIEIAGLRQFDTANNAWTGQEGFDHTSTLKSRGLIVGANAVQMAFGKMPDYKFQESQDFGIKSESAVEVWMETQKARLVAESSDYADAKVAGFDWGVVAVDVEI